MSQFIDQARDVSPISSSRMSSPPILGAPVERGCPEAFYTAGDTTSSGNSWSAQGGSTQTGASSSTTLNYAKRDLMTPDEVMRAPDYSMILLRPGRQPLWAYKISYFADAEFAGLW